MTSTFLTRFPNQLGHWTIHGICNALPSFIIALVFLKLWKSPQAVAAMVLAVTIFIVAFAVAISLPWTLSDSNHVLGRSIRLGAKIRSWIAGLSLPCVLAPQMVVFMPDTWCGLLAVWLQYQADRYFRMGMSFNPTGGDGASARFLPTFTTTMLEGFIISFMLLTISFFCVIFLQSRERKRLFKAASEARSL